MKAEHKSFTAEARRAQRNAEEGSNRKLLISSAFLCALCASAVNEFTRLPPC